MSFLLQIKINYKLKNNIYIKSIEIKNYKKKKGKKIMIVLNVEQLLKSTLLFHFFFFSYKYYPKGFCNKNNL